MKTMISGRGGGKTTEALKLLAEHPTAILICVTEQEAVRLRDISEAEPERIISLSNLDKLRGRARGPVLLDNVDWMLESLLGVDRRDLWASFTR